MICAINAINYYYYHYYRITINQSNSRLICYFDCYRDFPVELKYQRPHIVLNQHKEIVAASWAPAFEGPLAVEHDDVEAYYEAYQAFAKEIKYSQNIVSTWI